MFWGLKLTPGSWTPYVPPPDVSVRLHVSQATAGCDETTKANARFVVKMRCETDEAVLAGVDPEDDDAADEDGFEKEEYRVCSLIEGRSETCGLDLVLDEYAEFTVEGPGEVHLTGYYMPDFDGEDGDEEDEDMYEDMMMGDEDFDSEDDEDFDDDEDSEDDDDDDEDDEDDEDDSEDDDSEDDSEDDDSEDDSEDDDDEESDSEDAGVTRKGGVKIVELEEEKKNDKKRPAEAAPAKTPEAKKQTKSAEPAKKPDTPKRVHKNGMEIINTFASKNPKAKLAVGGKKVVMKYIGKLPSGKIFDQTKGSNTFAFRLQAGEVIRGWDVGVEGMREGDKRTLIIPGSMAYGKKGIKGVIPPNATLHFDVELVKVL